MNLNDAEKMAKELIAEHCPNWSFKFDNAKRRLGCCKERIKTITLSRYYVRDNEEHLVKDTILHEIAHALVGAKAGHGWRWRSKAREIGCSAKRCKSQEEDGIVSQEGRFKYVCPNCGYTMSQHKRSSRKSACRDCCTKYAGGRFDERFVFVGEYLQRKPRQIRFKRRY